MMSSASRNVVLGIDFGTSYSAAAALIGGRVEYVLDNGEPKMPSVVHIPGRGEPIVGSEALLRLVVDPAHTAASVKRLLGLSFHDSAVRALDAGVGFRMKPGANNAVVIEARGREFACEQVAGFVLARLRALAEQRFGARIRHAVVGVPAAAAASYVQALRRAAQLAGLEVVQVVPEPIAGALALGLHAEAAKRKLVVCDFGGGTFDATLVDQEGHVFTPTATAGDPFLGGDDFDESFAEAVASVYYRKSGFQMRKDAVRWQQLLFRCESVKRILSTQTEAQLTMKDAFVHQGQRQDIDVIVDRSWLEPKWQPLADRCVAALGELLRVGEIRAKDIDDVVLIGGSGLVPLVRRAIGTFFPRKRLVTNEWASLAVVTGLALQTAAHANIATAAPVLARPVATANARTQRVKVID